MTRMNNRLEGLKKKITVVHEKIMEIGNHLEEMNKEFGKFSV